MNPEQEIQLSGGNVSTVVRIGNTVRREMGPWSPAVHDLLRHLEAKGFAAAPRFLGIDEQGREILTFIEGDIGNYPLQLYMWSDKVLQEAARLLRQFHDTTTDYTPLHDAYWQLTYSGSMQHEVICHNDIAPYNTVYANERPRAFIDFDIASPGPRMWDIAHAAYRFVPLLHIENAEMQKLGLTDPSNQARRLRLFCDAYGLIQPREVLNMLEPRLETLCTTIVENADAGHASFQKMLVEGHLAYYQREIETLQRYRDVLL